MFLKCHQISESARRNPTGSAFGMTGALLASDEQAGITAPPDSLLSQGQPIVSSLEDRLQTCTPGVLLPSQFGKPRPAPGKGEQVGGTEGSDSPHGLQCAACEIKAFLLAPTQTKALALHLPSSEFHLNASIALIARGSLFQRTGLVCCW